MASPDVPDPLGHAQRRHWTLDPGIHFLNHGSYGATPRVVLESQSRWRARMERQPVQFMNDVLPGALAGARDRLADFVRSPRESLVFAVNATEACAAVLRSLDWKPGDRIVLANHAYPAIRNTVRFLAGRYGVVPVEAGIPWPLPGDDALVDAYADALRGGARLAIFDHVFSPLGVVSPLGRLLPLARAAGAQVLVDGAHAPGQLDLDVGRLFEMGATWFAGNAHKWLCAPKGAAFLAVSDAGREGLHPVVISNFYGEGLAWEFGWTGTRDPSAWLAVGEAIDFIESIGAARYRSALATQQREAADLMAAAWGVQPGAPASSRAAMATLPMPIDEPATRESVARWRLHFLREHRTEVPVFDIGGRHWVRISAQVYNELSDFAPLAAAFQPQG
ncbi:MAG: aminotransferase class V-fold PLP-dependent enzyme [Betaproteobacteria bacterium]|nr:aminotransferase class V-fold PLP-dependent enzyme [Betaproteobacteria bacterium]